DTPGFTGRWMVVDYTLNTDVIPSRDVLAIQMMDIDLSPDNDQFTYVPEYDMAVIHYGTTYIGLSYFNSIGPQLMGHNAGEMTSSVFDGEDAIYNHMSNPNNQSTSATRQNWYMDLVARVPRSSFPGEAHVSFVIVVGSSLNELRNAVEDAREGIRGKWESTPPEGWQRGHIDIVAEYRGIQWPLRDIQASQSRMFGGRDLVEVEFDITGEREITLHINTSQEIPDQGSLQYRISSVNPIGYFEGDNAWSIKADNTGPDILLQSDVDPGEWGSGTVEVTAVPNDHGGSGTEFVYMSVNGGNYYQGSIVQITEDGDDMEVSAYAIDYLGQKGPTVRIAGIRNDGTPPVIESISTIPVNITEDSRITISIAVKARDPTSGLNHSTAEFRWGFDTATSAPADMSWNGSAFIGIITNSWDASQGRNLAVSVDVGDIAGNSITRDHIEYIDPVNDPPEYSMVSRSDPWQRDEILIEFIGEDPDGDLPHFDLMYSLSETGGYVDIDDSDIQKKSPILYTVRIPRIDHEGPIYIKGSASDGEAISQMDTIQVLIDRKAPKLIFDPPTTIWSHGLIWFGSTDNGSGVDSEWIMISGSGPDRKIEANYTHIDEDGIYNVSIFSRDLSGNVASHNLGVLKVDITAPEVVEVVLNPEEPVPGDDLEVHIHARDEMSGLSAQAKIIFTTGEGLTMQGMGQLQDNIYSIVFEDIPPSPMGYFQISIQLIDNSIMIIPYVFGPFYYKNTTDDCPLEITYPDEIESGESFWINVTHDGPITFHTIYPGVYWDWILTPKRTEGDTRSYQMPAPYAGGEIRFFVDYGGERNDLSSRCPEEGWFTIEVTGAEDRDGDGLEDHWEVEYGLDPSSPDDPDKDGDEDDLTNIEEMYNLTDPKDSDTDGDEMPDGWEAKYGTLPFRDDPNDDPDGDGWSNVAEMVNGKDPRDPEDHPEEARNTPWYWMVMIFLGLMGIIGYFVFQMFSRRKLEDDLEEVDRSAREDADAEDWETN
ncbi:MAG: hypothetical protein ACMUIG_10620, partial [Thermoplasmatota archaeon]